MKKTTDLNPERSEKYRHLDTLGYVPRFIIISACCAFVAAFALLIGALSLYNSTDANAKVDYELAATRKELLVSQNRTTLYITYVQTLHSDLIIKGFEPPPLPEER